MEVWKTTESGRELYKEPVIAFAVKTGARELPQKNRRKRISPWLQPITLETVMVGEQPLDGDSDMFEVESDGDFEIIPAPDETYKVTAHADDGVGLVLGYVHPGASTPDWDQAFEQVANSERPE